MKKIERAAYFIKENMQLFRCPVCQSQYIEIDNNQLICPNNHTFNLSKKGTVYFLNGPSSNQYDKQLFDSRKRIADSGFWDPILDVISEQIRDNQAILDVGCGNGSHLNKIKHMIPSSKCIGFDISKQGIEMAAANYLSIFWCVADLANIPFMDESFDILLNLFTPSNYKEFKRLMKPDGKVIKVVPDKDYLIELRQLKNNKEYSNAEVVNNFYEEFDTVNEHKLTYQSVISKSLVDDLLQMTPLGWQMEKEAIDHLKREEEVKITIDIKILIGQN